MIDAILLRAAGQANLGADIVVQCSGGVAGIRHVVSLAPDGRLTRSERGDRTPQPVGRIPPAKVKALAARLNKVSFATLVDLPRNTQIRDGIDCAITRTGLRTHTLRLWAGSRRAEAQDALRYGEVRTVMSAVFGAADRDRLNPQPISPVDVPVK